MKDVSYNVNSLMASRFISLMVHQVLRRGIEGSIDIMRIIIKNIYKQLDDITKTVISDSKSNTF